MTAALGASAFLFLLASLTSTPCAWGFASEFSEVSREPLSIDAKIRKLQAAGLPTDIGNSGLPGFSSEVPEIVGHQDLGGNAASLPCCVGSKEGVHSCFIRGKDSNVYHKHVGSEEHPGWVDLELIAVGDLGCLKTPDGNILLLAIDSTGCLMANRFVDEVWQGWKKTGALGLLEVPSCVAISKNKIDCVYRSVTGKTYKMCFWWGVWLPPMCTGGKVSSPVGCVFSPVKGLECFSSQIDYRLQFFWGIGMWRTWWPIQYDKKEARVQDRPSAITYGGGEKEVFARSLDNQLARISWKSGGRVQPWEHLGGNLGSAPCCVRLGHGQVTCFAVNYVSYLMFNSLKAGNWSGWTPISNGMDGPPSCFQTGKDHINCYVRGAMTASIYEVTLKP